MLWSHEHGVSARDGFSTAIALDGDSFLLTGRSESAAFRIADGKVTELWKNSNLKGSFVMPVVHDGHVYGVNAKFLTCVDAATGEQRWKARESASGLILVDGHLVVFGGEGEVVVGAARPEAFNAAARLKVAETGGYTFPTYSDGGVYVRNLEKIARVDVK